VPCHAYTAAITGTPAESIVALNVAVEAASYDFFNQLAPTLQELDIESWYWELHRTADEFHSADGLAMWDECEPGFWPPDTEDAHSSGAMRRHNGPGIGAHVSGTRGYATRASG
jgi:hypothetical protein